MVVRLSALGLESAISWIVGCQKTVSFGKAGTPVPSMLGREAKPVANDHEIYFRKTTKQKFDVDTASKEYS